VWRVLGCLTDVIDRGPADAGTGEDLVQRLCCYLDVLSKVNWKVITEAVNDKIKQVLFFYLSVCLCWLHIFYKQTLSLKPM